LMITETEDICDNEVSVLYDNLWKC